MLGTTAGADLILGQGWVPGYNVNLAHLLVHLHLLLYLYLTYNLSTSV